MQYGFDRICLQKHLMLPFAYQELISLFDFHPDYYSDRKNGKVARV